VVTTHVHCAQLSVRQAVEVLGVVCWAIWWHWQGTCAWGAVQALSVGGLSGHQSFGLHQGCSGCDWRVLWICVEVCIQHVG